MQSQQYDAQSAQSAELQQISRISQLDNRNITSVKKFSFTPTTLDEALQYAAIIAKSGICPKNYHNKPNDVLVIIQMGHEMGLPPMQALRTIGCINGIPFVYGDGLLALAKMSPDFVGITEYAEGDIAMKTYVAHCTITRMGKNGEYSVTRSFSWKDAERAGLTTKSGPWTQYPKRMIQMRARSFCIRDTSPEVFYNLQSEDEVYNIIDVESTAKPVTSKGLNGLKQAIGINVNAADISNYDEDKLAKLKKLLADQNVLESTIAAALSRNKVNTIEQLPDDFVNKWISHLQEKSVSAGAAAVDDTAAVSAVNTTVADNNDVITENNTTESTTTINNPEMENTTGVSQ